MEAIKYDVTKQDALRNALYLSTPARAQAPSLEVCLAKTAAEVLEAQKLRFNIFSEEYGITLIDFSDIRISYLEDDLGRFFQYFGFV